VVEENEKRLHRHFFSTGKMEDVCDLRYAIHIKTVKHVYVCATSATYWLGRLYVYLVSLINVSRCRNLLPFCKLL
jgi:hypothetical protein